MMRWLDGRKLLQGLRPLHLTELGRVVADMEMGSARAQALRTSSEPPFPHPPRTPTNAVTTAQAGSTNKLAAAESAPPPLTGNEPPEELMRRVRELRERGEEPPPEIRATGTATAAASTVSRVRRRPTSSGIVVAPRPGRGRP